MRAILSLFGKSPFSALQSHMDCVAKCVNCLPKLFDALEAGNIILLEEISSEISRLEHDADLIKNDIRNNLPTSLLLPINRTNLLEILTLQDSIADEVEDVGVLATLKPLELLPIFRDEFKLFVQKNLETFKNAQSIINELHELIESSFGGTEAKKVQSMVNEVAYNEHEVDLVQRKLLKSLFKAEDQLTYITFHLWQRLFHSIGAISNLSENLAYRIRMTLELK